MQLVASDQQGTQGGGLGPVQGEQLLGQGSGHKLRVMAWRWSQACKRVGDRRVCSSSEADAGAREQGRPEFPGSGIEAQTGEVGSAVARRRAKRCAGASEEIEQAAVGDGHAFGPPGGAGSVDHIGQIQAATALVG